MFRRLEKKFNARIIDLLTLGTNIENPERDSKTRKHSVRQFFKDGVKQLSKDVQNNKQDKTRRNKLWWSSRAKAEPLSFRQKIGLKKSPPRKKTFREKLWFKD